MPAAKPAPDAEWLTKRDAARFLGISNRQLERRAYEGYIAKRFLPRKPTDRSQTVEYKREDLVALKAGAPNMSAVVRKEPKAKVLPKPNAAYTEPAQPAASAALAVVHDAPRNGDPWDALAAKLAGLAAAFPTAAPAKPWLTLDEAVAWSGLSRAYLLRRAREGWAAAVDQSAGAARQQWRFNREGLAR
jgi:hypothetical protein